MDRKHKFATLTTIKKEVVPLLVQQEVDDGAGDGEPHTQYVYASDYGPEDLANSQEVVIDENGRAVAIHHLLTEDGQHIQEIQEVEAIENEDGTHTILHIVPTEDTCVVEEEEEETQEILGGDGPATQMGKTKNFFCGNCGNCYSAAGSLKLHMRACLRQRPEVPPEERTCSICNKVFNSASYLKEHMLRHTGDGPKRCTRCYRKFLEEEKFNAHMEAHKHQDKLDEEAAAVAAQHGGKKVVVKEFTCSFCYENFTVVFEAGQVKRRYACDACREKYSNAEALKKHKQKVEEKRDFNCERCGRRFVFEGFLQRHIPTCDGTIKRRRDMYK